MSAPDVQRSRAPCSRREAWLALLVAAVLFGAALSTSLFDSRVVLFGVDTATVQSPWNAAIAAPGGAARAARNPALADQGMVFYPAYRFVSESWRALDPPLWNPWIYAGAPAAGNPQLGVFDPQVGVLVVLEALFGRIASDWGLAWLAWSRLVLAAWGAYLLARRLGVSSAGASISGATFGLAGFGVLWLNHSLGHVSFWLPWLLLALEGVRGERWARCFAAASAVLALAILGGHPETAFYVGACAGVWSLAILRDDRVAGARALAALAVGTLLAGVSLVPFAEYLANSGALVARRLVPSAGEPDWVALGAIVLAIGVVVRWRALVRERAEDAQRFDLRAALGLGVAIAAAGWIAYQSSPSPSAQLVLWPDLFGAPGKTPGGYLGAGSFLEEASAWVPMGALGLAIAALLSPGASDGSGLRRRGLIAVLALGSVLLALRTPGVLELYRYLPLIGLGATVRLAAVSSLMLALLAGEGFDRSTRTARIASALAIGALCVACWIHAPLEPLDAELQRGDTSEGIVVFTERPGAQLDSASARLEGWVHPALSFGTLRARAEPIGDQGESTGGADFELPVETALAPWSGTDRHGAPEGATFFRTSFLWLDHLPEGHWRFSLDVYSREGRQVASRIAGSSTLERAPRPEPLTFALVVASLLALAGTSASSRWSVLLLAAILAQGLWFFAGTNPAVPREECFPPTLTEQILARELGSRRYLSDPGVLPPNTGMVRRLRAIDGYDGLDPASFDGYRAFALHAGVQPLLGFNARGADLDSAAFKLLGVGALVLSAPLAHPGWQLVAGPEPGAPERAECWIYRAVDPLPQAFCVKRAVPKEEVLADLAQFDPRESAFLEDGAQWGTQSPFTEASAQVSGWKNGAIDVSVTLDGEGLLVLLEQHFPGWRVEVDGVDRPLLRVDSIFRGVALGPGEHAIRFRYAPNSLRVGIGLSLVSAALIAILLWRTRARRAS